MLKKIFFFSFLGVFITFGIQQRAIAQNPDLPRAPEWEFGTISEIEKNMPGLKFNASNFNTIYDNQKVINSWGYKAKPWSDIKDLLPEALYNMLIRPEMWGNFRINETAYIPPAGKIYDLYMQATEKYKGEPYLDEDGWLRNYKAGIPFPTVDPQNDPQGALKLMWNWAKRGKGGGDRTYDSFVTMLDRNGRRKFSNSAKDRMYFFDRLIHDPKPVYEPNHKHLEYMMYSVNKLPYNVAGTIAVINRYDIPGRNDDMWIYVPSLRRVRRMSTAERQDKMSGGKDFVWDSVETFDGTVANYNFKLLETKTMLLPLCCTNVPSDISGGYINGVDDYWQRRKTYVISIIPKEPVNISEMVIYMDAETFQSNLGIVRDTKGRDWMVGYYTTMRGKDGALLTWHANSVDLITRHASKNWNVNIEFGNNYNPDMFAMENLKRQFLIR